MKETKIPAHIHSLIYSVVLEALDIGPSMVLKKDLIEILDWCISMETVDEETIETNEEYDIGGEG